MCVALLSVPGKSLTKEALQKGWNGNPNGGGFCYVKDGKVEIEKGFMQFEPFYEAYAKAVENYSATSTFLIHMRIRTSGATNPNNCHPFPIRNGALIHNGIMFTPGGKRAGEKGDLKSDTRVFAEDLFNILHLDHVRAAEADIRKAIGGGNKICFLYDDGKSFILGENLGTWVDGVWHSNNSCGGVRYAGGY